MKKMKNERKERRDNVTTLLPHLCFRVAPCSSYRECLELSLPYTSGNFHYRTWLCIFWWWASSNARGLHEQASWMHTHLVSVGAFILIALVHPLHGNPYSLTLISIDGNLHSPLIRLVDVRLSSPFCLLHNHHFIPPIVLCPWLTLMYCVKVEKVWEHQKYEKNSWLVIRVVHDLNILCDEDGA